MHGVLLDYSSFYLPFRSVCGIELQPVDLQYSDVNRGNEKIRCPLDLETYLLKIK